MKYVEALTRELEIQIERQFKDLPSAGADIIICAVIREADEKFLKGIYGRPRITIHSTGAAIARLSSARLECLFRLMPPS
jgi:hypothetical protein